MSAILETPGFSHSRSLGDGLANRFLREATEADKRIVDDLGNIADIMWPDMSRATSARSLKRAWTKVRDKMRLKITRVMQGSLILPVSGFRLRGDEWVECFAMLEPDQGMFTIHLLLLTPAGPFETRLNVNVSLHVLSRVFQRLSILEAERTRKAVNIALAAAMMFSGCDLVSRSHQPHGVHFYCPPGDVLPARDGVVLSETVAGGAIELKTFIRDSQARPEQLEKAATWLQLLKAVPTAPWLVPMAFLARKTNSQGVIRLFKLIANDIHDHFEGTGNKLLHSTLQT
jgi:hypothetical protein